MSHLCDSCHKWLGVPRVNLSVLRAAWVKLAPEHLRPLYLFILIRSTKADSATHSTSHRPHHAPVGLRHLCVNVVVEHGLAPRHSGASSHRNNRARNFQIERRCCYPFFTIQKLKIGCLIKPGSATLRRGLTSASSCA